MELEPVVCQTIEVEGTFRFREVGKPCGYWSDGAHIVTGSACRCGLRIEIMNVEGLANLPDVREHAQDLISQLMTQAFGLEEDDEEPAPKAPEVIQ